MATLKPFRALRPRPELAASICTLPYDVMSTAEAKVMAGDNPLSFLRVTRAELELDPGADPYADEVYQRGARNLQRLVKDGALFQDSKPRYYIYRLIMEGRSQTGLVAAASCADYDADMIRKHEKTRADKEEDRTRHIRILGAQTGPVFLFHKANPQISALWEKLTQAPPDVDYTAATGVRHTAWVVSDDAVIAQIQKAFQDIPLIYVADGHHRSAAAARIARERRAASPKSTGQEPWNYFLSVTFPDDQLHILGYNRLVKDLNGLSEEEFLGRVSRVAEILPAPENRLPKQRGDVVFYLKGQWRMLRWKPGTVPASGPAAGPARCRGASIHDPHAGARHSGPAHGQADFIHGRNSRNGRTPVGRGRRRLCCGLRFASSLDHRDHGHRGRGRHHAPQIHMV